MVVGCGGGWVRGVFGDFGDFRASLEMGAGVGG